MTCTAKIALKSFLIVFIFAAMFLYNRTLIIIEGSDFLKDFEYANVNRNNKKHEDVKRQKTFDHLANIR